MVTKHKPAKPSDKPNAKANGHDEQVERIKRLIRAQGKEMLALPNVTSVGIGYKEVKDQRTPELALQFTVERKLEPQSLVAESVPPIPKTIEFEGKTISTDVLQRSFKPSYVEVQLQAKSDRKTRQDPIRPGISVGRAKSSSAGTLGAIVRDGASGAPLILSNWHVLNGAFGEPGDDIVQPGPFDDNQLAGNRVGTLLRSHLGLAGDCAVASIEQRKLMLAQLELDVPVTAIGKAELGDRVVKSGRTTAVTFGRVSRIEALFKLRYEGRGEEAIGGFEIEPVPDHEALDNEISRGGDSGSAWLAVDQNGKPTTTMLGLHFGGDAEGSDGEFALACYAHSVFQKLEIVPFEAKAVPLVQAKKPPPDEALRRGFATGFLAFEVALPKFHNGVAKDLVGLAGNKHIDYCHFSVWLSKKRKLPVCVAWNVDGALKKSLSRKGIPFLKDEREGIDEFQVGDELYAGNDLDRGHVARRDDLVWGELGEARQANVDSFFFTNMAPQHKAFNQSQLKGKWGQLENAILDEVVLRDLRVSLMGGPVLASDDTPFRGVPLPREFWKAVFYTDDEDGENKARAFILTQKDLLDQMRPEALELDEFRWYQVPLVTVEQRTGVRFNAALHRVDTKFVQGVGQPQARLVGPGGFFAD